MAFTLIPAGRGYNYTGIFTRSIIFVGALIAFLAATGLTLAAIIIPDWISFVNHTSHKSQIHYTYGLHRRCFNTTPSHHHKNLKCVPFPRQADCNASDRYFCSIWKTMAFLMSFGVVIEGMTIIAFLILILGNKARREQGWAVLAILVTIAALVQAVAMSLTAYLFDNDSRFFAGWFLDRSWGLCTASWSIQALCAAAITLAALTLPSEGGYELIPDSA